MINIKLDEKAVKTVQKVVGGDGGSVIVDALPAQGVEGTTYLLRKKDGTFKGHLYASLNNPFYVLVSDFSMEQIIDIINERLDFELDEESLVTVNLFEGLLEVMSPTEWERNLSRGSYVFVETEQDVLNLTETYDVILQDLGEIYLQDFKLIEAAEESSDTTEIFLNAIVKDSLVDKTVITENTIQLLSRAVGPTFQLEHPYSFSEWGDTEEITKLGELTDTFVYDPAVLEGLKLNEGYLINLTPEPEVYSYMEYVFDKGTYTIVGGGSGSASYLLQVRHGSTTPTGTIFFSCQVTNHNIKSYSSLYNYLLDNHYLCYFSSGELDGAFLPIVGIFQGNGVDVQIAKGICASGNGIIEILVDNGIYDLLENPEETTISYVE